MDDTTQGTAHTGRASDRDPVQMLLDEIREVKAIQQTMKQELSTVNEGLSTVNEELTTVNEGLSTVNEELNTVNEGLSTVNEELSTVKAELQGRKESVQMSSVNVEQLRKMMELSDCGLTRIRNFPKATELLGVEVGKVDAEYKAFNWDVMRSENAHEEAYLAHLRCYLGVDDLQQKFVVQKQRGEMLQHTFVSEDGTINIRVSGRADAVVHRLGEEADSAGDCCLIAFELKKSFQDTPNYAHECAQGEHSMGRKRKAPESDLRDSTTSVLNLQPAQRQAKAQVLAMYHARRTQTGASVPVVVLTDLSETWRVYWLQVEKAPQMFEYRGSALHVQGLLRGYLARDGVELLRAAASVPHSWQEEGHGDGADARLEDLRGFLPESEYSELMYQAAEQRQARLDAVVSAWARDLLEGQSNAVSG